MSDQELSELLAHPRVRSYVERVADDAALRALARVKVIVQARKQPKDRLAADGDVNYIMAATYIGCSYGSVRYYVSTGKLIRGKLFGTVTMESCIAFKARYKPRPNTRASNP